ncbi:MAG: hypothetical protein N3C13_00010 [Aquificaceae bacterium]|nr:hypothetical protein [Aquificaceae bacterium]MCX8059566.1 hypothetical protein [Aquificaceae bacterium]MDW8096717.1 hypothetical protein [Aquificaceae bacterium]
MDYATAKFLHLIGIFVWASASSSLGLFLLYSTHRPTGCSQQVLRDFYRWMTNLEIAGFVLALSMGFYMLYLMEYRFDLSWLNRKLPLVLGVLLPLEVLNFWFVNFHIPRAPDKPRAYRHYDLFVYVVALPLLVVSLLVIYLAVVKP